MNQQWSILNPYECLAGVCDYYQTETLHAKHKIFIINCIVGACSRCNLIQFQQFQMAETVLIPLGGFLDIVNDMVHCEMDPSETERSLFQVERARARHLIACTTHDLYHCNNFTYIAFFLSIMQKNWEFLRDRIRSRCR